MIFAEDLNILVKKFYIGKAVLTFKLVKATLLKSPEFLFSAELCKLTIPLIITNKE